MKSLRELNEELLLNPQKDSDHAPHVARPPHQPYSAPSLAIGCPGGCGYFVASTGLWSPYRHERSGVWVRVWYFSASCPWCVTPEGVTEKPFSVYKSQERFAR